MVLTKETGWQELSAAVLVQHVTKRVFIVQDVDVRSVYENKTYAASKEQIDVEVQEANAVSLD